jgi:DNA-binding PadR family transcriptional regulator
MLHDTSQNKVNDTMTFKFDEMISAPCRLGILATLIPGEAISFTEMKTTTSLSDGNLHVQTRKLADIGYIDITKTKKGRRTVTKFSITELGRERLRLHVAKLQKILDADTGTKAATKAVSRAVTEPAARPSRRPEQKPAQKPVPKPVRKPDDSAVWA